MPGSLESAYMQTGYREQNQEDERIHQRLPYTLEEAH